MEEVTAKNNEIKLMGIMKIDSRGLLNIGGISAEELVIRYGTPLLVMVEKKIKDNLSQYISAFEENYSSFKVLYAAKAFLNRSLCKILAREGAGIDVVSGGELYIALKAGFPTRDIYFHGNNKLPAEIRLAVENNIGRFMVDNFYEADLLNKIAGEYQKKAAVSLRIVPGIEAHTHEYIQTGQLDSKFGVSIANQQALDLIKTIINHKYLELKGIHVHIGSQIFNLEPYQKLIEVVFNFLNEVRNETGMILEEINLGGGLGISHINSEKPPTIGEYIKTITEKVIRESKKEDYPLPRILVEPGRSIIGDAGVTLYRIGSIKQVPGMTKYIAVDGGMTDNIRPALYEAEYTAFVANRCQEKAVEEVTVAGKCCESGDILIKNIKLPETETGDILVIPATGAYTYPMASNYNGIPRPAVVLVNEGKSEIIVKRESYSDLLTNDVIPERFN